MQSVFLLNEWRNYQVHVYKINDVISCDFLKIPKAMFANSACRKLSSDAKLTYALLYDRLSLSKLNGWINDRDEVYLIYTREEIAEDLGITYKKSISAFKELLAAGLITEQRCGRGAPNKIYIVKVELNSDTARGYVNRENSRTAKAAHLDSKPEPEICKTDISERAPDIPKRHIKNCQSGISAYSETTHRELPKPHTNKTNDNQTNFNYPYISPSVSPKEQYDFEKILDGCQLESFEEDERKVLYDAIERLFYSENFRIGNAVLPRARVRSRLCELDVSVLQSAMERLHSNRDRPVKNLTHYVMSVIFNSLTEDYTLVHVDPYLNSLRGCAGCT